MWPGVNSPTHSRPASVTRPWSGTRRLGRGGAPHRPGGRWRRIGRRPLLLLVLRYLGLRLVLLAGVLLIVVLAGAVLRVIVLSASTALLVQHAIIDTRRQGDRVGQHRRRTAASFLDAVELGALRLQFAHQLVHQLALGRELRLQRGQFLAAIRFARGSLLCMGDWRKEHGRQPGARKGRVHPFLRRQINNIAIL